MRSTPEWIAKHDDEAIPPRVRVRVFGNGICAKCGRQLLPGKWACDHVIALANGGQHREANLQPLCNSPCHSGKTARDVAIKSKTYHMRAKAIGVSARKGPGIQSRGFGKSSPQNSASRPVERRS